MTTEERLEVLEKELARTRSRARWSLVGTALVIVVGVVFCITAYGPSKARPAGGTEREVRAGKFTLVTQDGTAQAVLHMTEDGPLLGLYDAEGKVRIGLTVTEAGPMLRLQDTQGNVRVSLAATTAGQGLGVYDDRRIGRIGMTVTEAGPTLGLLDAQGKARVGLTVQTDGPSLDLYDAQEKSIWRAP